jgi:hypothetical protein
MALIALTVIDLRLVRGVVGDAIFVANPPVSQRDQSPVRELLRDFPKAVRLFCRGQNLPTLLGVASTPVYLGIGPDEYFDPQTAMPEPWPFDEPATAEQVDWLRRAGVTHVLSFSALDEQFWPVRFVWSGYDPFLCRAWARGPGEPLFLYELKGTRGRVAWQEPDSQHFVPKVQDLSANRVVIEADSAQGGTLILTDLAYPGWEVTVDGQPAAGERFEGMYRSVKLPAGDHTVEWTFCPASVRWGMGITGMSCLLLIALPFVCRFRKDRGEMRNQPSP